MRKPPTTLATHELDALIYEVRGHKVMLDFDLAKVYDVETKSLNRGVKGNADRFPKDFMFQLTRGEFEALRYQIGTLKSGRGQHRKYLPYVFTEHGGQCSQQPAGRPDERVCCPRVFENAIAPGRQA